MYSPLGTELFTFWVQIKNKFLHIQQVTLKYE